MRTQSVEIVQINKSVQLVKMGVAADCEGRALMFIPRTDELNETGSTDPIFKTMKSAAISYGHEWAGLV